MSRTTHAVMGAAMGAVAGYAWHRLVGCSKGTCPIAANPFISALYGAMVGIMIALG